MIPRIDVRGAIAKKQFSEELNFEYEADGTLLDIPFVSFSSPVEVALRYEILENDDVEVTGQMRFSLKGECSRCLADTEQSFVAELDGLFVAGESDGETYGYRNGVIYLEEFLRDGLLVALPPRLLCGDCNAQDGENE